MLQDVIIPNPEKLEKIKKAIAKDGAEKIHILTDFDRTLTTAFIDRKSVPSLISILRDKNYLTPDYADKAHALYAKYHAIENGTYQQLVERNYILNKKYEKHRYNSLCRDCFKR